MDCHYKTNPSARIPPVHQTLPVEQHLTWSRKGSLQKDFNLLKVFDTTAHSSSTYMSMHTSAKCNRNTVSALDIISNVWNLLYFHKEDKLNVTEIWYVSGYFVMLNFYLFCLLSVFSADVPKVLLVLLVFLLCDFKWGWLLSFIMQFWFLTKLQMTVLNTVTVTECILLISSLVAKHFRGCWNSSGIFMSHEISWFV